MGFLLKYRLNGALCDEMGLGKTLQMLAVMENEIQKLKVLKRVVPPSLIVAPTTIVFHWESEIAKFLSRKARVLVVSSHKTLVRAEDLARNEYVLISYATLQRVSSVFQEANYLFLVVDEGHMIRNSKLKVVQLIKQLHAQHRFLLSGTPIQNSLQELWSIFDFLLPGYLGSEEYFRKHYRNLFNVNLFSFSPDDLCFTEEQNQVLADLHRRVMPFIMRRSKREVLTELPPKIIQDYCCTMTELQA